MYEPFGPEYVRPAQVECPRCSCCSTDLCERGRYSVLRCYGHTSDETQELVRACPCSAETTRHTTSWRAAQVRVTRMARQLPLPPGAEALLRALAAGQVVSNPTEVSQLKLRALAQVLDARPAITDLGRTYLRARDGVWEPATVRVLDIDVSTRTVLVECGAWKPGVAVTVLLDQILSESGVAVGSVPGWLSADANVQAEDADQMVMVGVRQAKPLVPNWMRIGGDE
ncbi:hypothetical protein ACWF94_10385 [Streptomyces sp. NPDC055078]